MYKKNTTSLGYLGVFIVFLMLMIGHVCPAVATTRVVRVGVIDFKGFSEKRSDGTYIGYSIDYLKEIKKYNPNWKYQYVEGNWSDLLKLLRERKIDLVSTARFDKKRNQPYNAVTHEGGYSFPDQPIGQIYSVLYTRSDNKTIFFNDYEKFAKTRIGFLKGSLSVEKFQAYMQKKLPNFIINSRYIRFYPNEKALVHALKTKAVEAISTEQLANHREFRTIARYGGMPFYFMSWYGSDLIKDLNRAISLIKMDNHRFEIELFEKFYPNNSVQNYPLLTRQEMEYMHKLAPIKVGLLMDNFPFSGLNEQTGETEGIIRSVAELVFKRAGLKYEFVSLPKLQTPKEALDNGTCDLVAGVVRSNFTDNSEVRVSDLFINSNLVIASRRGYKFDPNASQILALNRSFEFLDKYIKSNFPKMKILYTDGLDQSLEAIREERADIIIQNAYALNYQIQNPRYDDIQIIPVSFLTLENAFVGKSSRIDPILMSVLNKAIDTISREEINSIINTYTIATPYKLKVSDILFIYRWQFSVFVIVVVLSICAIFAIMAMRQRNYKILNDKNQQLAEAVFQARQASHSKGQFLANMSHEIRTPLNAIIGMTTLASKLTHDPKKVESYLNKITISSQILLDLINGILDISAIESKKLKIAHSRFNIKKLIVALSELYASECKNKGVNFEWKMSDEIANNLIGDALRLNQILLNLLSNAVKFTAKDGKVSLNISMIKEIKNQQIVRFTVSDTGEGMSPEIQSRLFQPFEQGTSLVASKHGGSGLGLSITRNLISMMHGTISVKSQKDVGSVFTVDLPFELSEDIQNISSDQFNTIRVLVVGDESMELDNISTLLHELNVRHSLSSSSEQALEMIEQAQQNNDPFILCLINWKMQDRDAITLFKKIYEINPSIKIALVSDKSLSEKEKDALSEYIEMFLDKPVLQSMLFNLLVSMTDQQTSLPKNDQTQFDFSGTRILLAEDNEINTEIAKELLHLVNVTVDHAADGQQAYNLFMQSAPWTYDMILMDIQMPIMNGYESTKAIRASKRDDALVIPIYAMTANAFTDDVVAAFSVGMNGHIAKPIDTKILYATLNKHLKKTKS